MCHSRKACHQHGQGYPVGSKDHKKTLRSIISHLIREIITFTENGKHEIQVENSSELKNKQINTVQNNSYG